MNILILGAGGVGGYVGALLGTRGGAEVILVARGEHLEAIRKNGLQIVEDDERWNFQPAAAVDDPSKLGVFDLILVTVKHTSLSESLDLISSNIGPEPVILPLMNGIDHRREILERYPKADVLEGCIYILSHIEHPGSIRKKGEIFRLCWGVENFDPADYAALRELFDRALPLHRPTEKIALEQWKKYLFIASMAALTSYHRTTMDRIVAGHREELEDLLGEIAGVARAKDVPLDETIVRTTLQRMEKTVPGAKTSMQRDLERGKPAEIEALPGYVVHEGARLGVPTPLMEQIYQNLKER
jgi:2-dehydropantoate 2-reductase